jgi:hypothetical protein
VHAALANALALGKVAPPVLDDDPIDLQHNDSSASRELVKPPPGPALREYTAADVAEMSP